MKYLFSTLLLQTLFINCDVTGYDNISPGIKTTIENYAKTWQENICSSLNSDELHIVEDWLCTLWKTAKIDIRMHTLLLSLPKQLHEVQEKSIPYVDVTDTIIALHHTAGTLIPIAQEHTKIHKELEKKIVHIVHIDTLQNAARIHDALDVVQEAGQVILHKHAADIFDSVVADMQQTVKIYRTYNALLHAAIHACETSLSKDRFLSPDEINATENKLTLTDQYCQATQKVELEGFAVIEVAQQMRLKKIEQRCIACTLYGTFYQAIQQYIQ